MQRDLISTNSIHAPLVQKDAQLVIKWVMLGCFVAKPQEKGTVLKRSLHLLSQDAVAAET